MTPRNWTCPTELLDMLDTRTIADLDREFEVVVAESTSPQDRMRLARSNGMQAKRAQRKAVTS